MAYQLGLAFAAITVAASSEHPELPANHLTLLRHPWRVWWAEPDDTAPTLTIDQGSAAAVAALFLDAANFATATLETSSDGSSWTPYDTIDIPVDPQLDDAEEPRRHVIVPLTGVSTRYLRLAPGALDAGAAQHVLGTIALVPSLMTLTVNFSEGGGWTRVEAATRIPYANDGFEVHRDGRPRMTAQFAGDPWPASSRDQLRTILAVGKGQPFLLYENAGDPTQAYIVARVNDVQVPREFKQIHFQLDVETFG